MSRHDHLDGLGIGDEDAPAERRGTRFLKRQEHVAERASGTLEEKTLRWVDPEDCVMWRRHNRAYDLLTEENCRDLIDGIRAQGRQEFPAIVRRTSGQRAPYEVICGARRHFAVSWLRANGYRQFKYLVDVREMTDEEAFRLADIENREREDISDFERARDYLAALDEHYGGSQKRMAERLEVSPVWLSRYLSLARLPAEVVAAYGSIRDIRERHARDLGPLLKGGPQRAETMGAARALAAEQERRAAHGEAALDGAAVLARLKAAGQGAKRRKPAAPAVYAPGGGAGISVRRSGRTLKLEMPAGASAEEARRWFEAVVDAELG